LNKPQKLLFNLRKAEFSEVSELRSIRHLALSPRKNVPVWQCEKAGAKVYLTKCSRMLAERTSTEENSPHKRSRLQVVPYHGSVRSLQKLAELGASLVDHELNFDR
jgi:hypothetical protein